MKKRLWLFKGIALLLPLLVLVLIEGLLRLVGYGHDYGLFVEDPQRTGYWIMNPHASERYFTETDNATVGNFEPFRQRKTEGTFRIFVLGESTTIGYPYFHNGSFHRWLHYRLMHTFPDRHFEVINLSLTAVNSYTVFGFAQQLPDYEPDAVLIYTGHNEYYGAMGVGSTSSLGGHPALVRLVLKLREFRVMQALTRALAGIRKTVSGETVNLRENLMKRMAADQQIPLGSDQYQRGIEQFRTNLDGICQVFSEKKIPVFISTLVSNEKGLKPLVSAPGAGSADQQFQVAKQAYEQGNFREAKLKFTQAKELDLLRFRAPEALNQVIRELENRYPEVTTVDTKAVFETHSPHGILGNETLLEHVHPNLYGYALLSDAFYEALKKKRLLVPAENDEISLAQLRQQMPLTPVDSLKGVFEVLILKEGWPFNEPMPPEEKRPKTVEEQLAGALVVKQISWSDAMQQLLAHYQKANNQRGALQVTEALMLEHPDDPVFYGQAGKIYQSLNQPERAVWCLKQAFQRQESFTTAQNLFITLLKLDRPDEALPYLRYAAAHNETTFSLTELQAFVEQLVATKKQYLADTTNVNLSNQLAAGYLRFANADGAAKYVAQSLRIDPRNATALHLRAQLQTLKTAPH
ncbi:SGNH/GDSL hydrolase family protein [Larkinella ripae]